MRAARPLAAVVAALAVAWLGAALYGYTITHTARRHHVEAAWYVVAVATLAVLATRRGSLTAEADAGPVAAPPPILARHAITGVAVAVAVSVALYWPTLWLGLLSDDYVLLELPLLPGDRWEFVRPLPLLLWSVVHPVAGPPGLHALNVVLHGVNGALLCALTLAIVPAARLGVGLLAAALLLTCPLAVEPVAWAAGVFDTLLVTWALAYLLALVYAPGPRWAIAGALVCLSAALATKESAVALPLLGALLAIRRRVSWLAIAASAAMCAAYAALRVSDRGVPLGDGSLRYLAKEVLGRPFGALGMPWTAADVGAMPILLGVAVPIGVAVLIVGYALGRHGHWRGLSTPAWVVAGAAPVMAYFFVAPDLSGARYAYLPLVGWSLLIAELAWRQGSELARRTAIVAVLAAVGLWAVGSHRRVGAYVDAAAVRDGVLAGATRVLASNTCAVVVLADPPSVHDGVYVWRNGLPEALRIATGRHVTAAGDQPVPAGCAFVWRDSAFVPRDAGP